MKRFDALITTQRTSPWTELGLKTDVYSEVSNTFFNNNLDLLFDKYIYIYISLKNYIQNAIIKLWTI